MKILGIDPGVATTGYGVIEYTGGHSTAIDYGVITTEPNIALSERLKSIYSAVTKILKKFAPDEMAVEEIFFAKNIKTAIMVSEARGVILLAGANYGLKTVNEYTPLEVKMALSGYGRAEKPQIQQMVKILLGLKTIPKPDDMADALAIAICHAHNRGRGGR
ncbi:MAG: crossover junction endodeoxyribonuclease RuvC [Candidatus Firestonebacteria bacterium]